MCGHGPASAASGQAREGLGAAGDQVGVGAVALSLAMGQDALDQNLVRCRFLVSRASDREVASVADLGCLMFSGMRVALLCL